MADIESKIIDYISIDRFDRLSNQNYKVGIEKSYSLLTTDKLREIVRAYKAKACMQECLKQAQQKRQNSRLLYKFSRKDNQKLNSRK